MRSSYFLSVIVLATFSLLSCEKSKTIPHPIGDEWNRAELISNGQKTGTLYNLSFQCGHSGANCSGCVTIAGQTVHVDCQGDGTTCNRSGIVNVQLVSGNIYRATTQDSTDITSDSFFNMPDRSLYMGMDNTGLPCWMNIPAQLVWRDSTTRLFTFNGVFFSQQQMYKNQ